VRPALRAVLYHRVSTIDQDPHAAELELHAAARVRGLRITLDIRETGSGATNDRPGLMRLMDAARRGSVDVGVLAAAVRRFTVSRSQRRGFAALTVTFRFAAGSLREPLPGRRLRPVGFVERGVGVGAGGVGAGFAR